VVKNVQKVVEIQHISQIKDENFHECFATPEDKKSNKKTTCWLPYKGKAKSCTFKHHGSCLIALNDSNANTNVTSMNFHHNPRGRLNTMGGVMLLNSIGDGANKDMVNQNTDRNLMLNGNYDATNENDNKSNSNSQSPTSGSNKQHDKTKHSWKQFPTTNDLPKEYSEPQFDKKSGQ